MSVINMNPEEIAQKTSKAGVAISHQAHPGLIINKGDLWESVYLNGCPDGKVGPYVGESELTQNARADFRSFFQETLDEAVEENRRYDTNGGRVYYQMDLNRFEWAYNNGHELAVAFTEEFYGAMKDTIEASMTPTVIINQYDHTSTGQSEVELDERVENVKSQIFSTLNEITDMVDIQSVPNFSMDRWKDYVDKLKEIKGETIRFSAEWSHLMDRNNEIIPERLNELAEMIQYAKDQELEIVLCMNHFTMPDWIERGWVNEDFPEYFEKYVKDVMKGLKKKGTLPEHVLTFNEPLSFIPAGYWEGEWPPYEKNKNPFVMEKAIRNVIKAHLLAYDAIKEDPELSDINVGFTYNLPRYEAWNKFNPVDQAQAKAYEILTWHYFRVYEDEINKRAIRLEKKTGKKASEMELTQLMGTDTIAMQYYGVFFVGEKTNLGAKSVSQHRHPTKRTFMNKWGIRKEGIVESLLEVNTWVLNLAKKLGVTKGLPKFAVSEVGFVSSLDPRPYLQKIFEALDIAQSLMVDDLLYTLAWTLNDPSELLSMYDNNSRLGIFDLKGGPKAWPNVEEPSVDYTDKSLRKRIREYGKSLQAFSRTLPQCDLKVQLDSKVEANRKYLRGDFSDVLSKLAGHRLVNPRQTETSVSS